MKIKLLLIFFGISLSMQTLQAQSETFSGNLEWNGLIQEKLANGQSYQYLYFEGASVDPNVNLPVYNQSISLDQANVDLEADFDTTSFIPCSDAESGFIAASGYNDTAIQFKTSIHVQNKKAAGLISFIPIRKNPETGLFEKLVMFELTAVVIPNNLQGKGSDRSYADHSVLGSGDWYKFETMQAGIYKISYNDLVNAGMDLSSVDPATIKLYGNGGGMLPEKNDKTRPDDLVENAIYISGEQDGSFDPEDYILFYGQSADEWYQLIGFFYHRTNLYEDHCYYYLTASAGDGKRIESQPYYPLPPNIALNTYNNYQAFEEDKNNLIESGKIWYGDEFGEINKRSYSLHFPNIEPGTEAIVKIGFANRTFVNDDVVITINGQVQDTLVLTSIQQGTTLYAQKKKRTFSFPIEDPEVKIDLEYRPAELSSRMWLDYIYVNARSKLKLIDGQLLFRDITVTNEGSVVEYDVSNATANTEFWEVTDMLNPVRHESHFENGISNIVVPTGYLREFAVFDGSQFLQPEIIGKIQNQDIHGAGPFEYVIVTNPLFRQQAEEIAAIHDSVDNFNGILVIEPEAIYNEFSSGKQDPTAIRDMIKMFYDKYPGNEPRYLLLIGDGSYDPKDRLEDNSNFIPTFQTEESLSTSTSYVVDDYFGLLDDNEGEDAYGDVDIGIGRLPVRTVDEAEVMVKKIREYLEGNEDVFGDWKNTLCIIADDEDSNLHIKQADSLSSGYHYIPDYINQRKVYLDAYHQITTPSGNKYPDVTKIINAQVDEGALIVNYIGHGGSGGWAHERIIQVSDIINWDNTFRLPLFITATCEFSRFDEPDIVSAGEWVLLNPNGGGIALMTTTRLAYSLSNFRLNERIYARAFLETDGTMPYLGDIIKYSKPPGQLTTRNFVLLGDPALRIGYPDYDVEVKEVKVNGNQSNSTTSIDTLSSLQQITVIGEIVDKSGQSVTDFNGLIFPKLFDKPIRTSTIGNDPSSAPFSFKQQTQILWQGKNTVKNGTFSVSFVIPRDMAQNIDKGKISFYAYSDTKDASGAYNDFILWGIDNEAALDNEGPDINIYLNDTNFVSGDQTHANPLMIASLKDEHGINISTNGIGHDITAILDDDYSNIIVLDPYYEQDMNSYQSGWINFPFHDLADGKHTLRLKAWDSYNNSNEASIEFFINSEASLQLTEVKNYPNPFNNETTFTLHHTKPGTELDIHMEIYDLFGKFVLSYETSVYSAGTTLNFLQWDGHDANGNKLGSGIYVYTVIVTDQDGNAVTQKQKFIIQK